MRIVSLLPSATEILYAIGAGDHVVGVTFECDEPPHARTDCAVVSNTTLPSGLTPSDIAVARPGPRLVDGVEALVGILHPDVGVTRPGLVQLIRPGASLASAPSPLKF